ncbi:MAG: hypothetical protein JWO40_890 [Candidatus Doudnabacteria bacterium]|nr:hypothetical protein [Candidatus Doudnabacteria bacterium]
MKKNIQKISKKSKLLLKTGMVLFFAFVIYSGAIIKVNFAHAANACVSTATGNSNVSGTWTSCGGTTPQPADTISIANTHTVTVVGTLSVAGVTIQNGGTLNAGSGTINDSGNFTINSGGTYVKNTGTLNFNGGIAQTVTDSNTTKQDLGTITVSAGAIPAISSTPIQSVTQISTNSTNSTAITLTSTPINGNTLIFGRADANTAQTVSSIVETGVTWAKAVSSATNQEAEIWYGTVGSGASTAITVNYGSTESTVSTMSVTEWSGIKLSSPVDAAAGNNGNSTTLTTATITPTASRNMLLIAAGRRGGAFSSGPTSGFTFIAVNQYAYLVVGSTTGSYSTSWTYTTSNLWEVEIAAFTAASTGAASTLKLGSSIKATKINVAASQTLDFNGSNTLTLTGSGTGASRPLINSGTFTKSTGITEYAGTSATEISDLTSDNVTYNALTLDPAATVTYTLGTAASQTLTAATLTIGDSTNALTLTSATYNPTINIAGSLAIGSAAAYTKGSGVTTLNSGNTVGVSDNTSSKQDLGAVVIAASGGGAASTVDLFTSLKLTSLLINASQTLDFNGSTVITITGSGTGAARPLINNGIVIQSSGTIDYKNAINGNTEIANVTSDNVTYNNLTIESPGGCGCTPNFRGGTAASQTLTVNGNLVIGDSTNAVQFSHSTYNSTINYLGNVTINANALYIKGTGVTTFKRGGTQTLTDNATAKQDVGAVVVAVNGTNTTLSLASSVKLTSLTINASQTFTANGSNTLTITGSGVAAARPLLNSGTFTQSTGTVEFIGTSTTEVASVTSGNVTYNNLIIDPAATVTYKLGTATSQTFTVNGNFTIGDATNALTLDDSAATGYGNVINLGGNWVINANAIFLSPTATVTLMKGGTQTVTDNTTTKQNLGNITIAVNGTNTTVNLGSDVLVTTLLINSSQTFSANGSNKLTITGSGTGASRPLINNGTFTQSTGTVAYTGSSATEISNFTSGNITFYNLSLVPAGTVTYTLGTAVSQVLAVTNNLVVGNGTNALTTTAATYNPTISVGVDFSIAANAAFTSTSGTLTIGRNFDNSGSFTHNSGTVVFNDNTQTSAVTISSGTTFNNITSTTAGKTIKFKKATTGAPVFTLAGTFLITGTPTSLITIQSDTNGSQWLPHFNSAQSSVTYANIQDSGCDTGTSNLTLDDTSINISNNAACWVFPSTIIISGNVYQDQLVSPTVWTGCDGTTKNISIAVNGAAKSRVSCNASTGAFTINKTAATNNIVVVYLDTNGGNKGVLYTRAVNSSTNITSLMPTKNVIWLRYETGSSVTNSDINTYDKTQDTDIPVDSNGTNIVGDSGTELFVDASKTFVPGGNVNVDNILIKGTYTGAADTTTTTNGVNIASTGTLTAPNALVIGGDLTNDGTFTHNSGTVTMNFAGGVTANVKGANNIVFNNFTGTSASPGAILQFKAGGTYTFAGTFGVQGVAGAPIKLKSTTGGSQWTATFNGSIIVNYLIVMDSTCSGGSNPGVNYTIVNSGNNGPCWAFYIIGGGSSSSALDGGTGGGTPVNGGGNAGTGGSGGSGGGTPVNGGGNGGGIGAAP